MSMSLEKLWVASMEILIYSMETLMSLLSSTTVVVLSNGLNNLEFLLRIMRGALLKTPLEISLLLDTQWEILMATQVPGNSIFLSSNTIAVE